MRVNSYRQPEATSAVTDCVPKSAIWKASRDGPLDALGVAMSKSKFQTIKSTQLEATTGGYYERWYGYRPFGPERFYAREERWGYGPYAYARFERRYGW